VAKLLLTCELRALLKIPLGELLTGTGDENMKALKRMISAQKPPRVICVGDSVCRNAIRAGGKSWIKIVDGKEMRRETGIQDFQGRRVFLVDNPPGTISQIAWEAVAEAIKYEGSLLIVNGEEDLLTLPAVLEAPNNSIVVYGQPPRAGMTVVKVDRDKKSLTKSVVDAMICEPNQGWAFT
jgi:uncharacterized protein (UPF0218 family)